jgi:hypothetical protein
MKTSPAMPLALATLAAKSSEFRRETNLRDSSRERPAKTLEREDATHEKRSKVSDE